MTCSTPEPFMWGFEHHLWEREGSKLPTYQQEKKGTETHLFSYYGNLDFDCESVNYSFTFLTWPLQASLIFTAVLPSQALLSDLH